jgi:phage I-like protein
VSDVAQKLIELVTLATTAQNNLKEVTTELATQRSLNTALINAVASIAAQLAKVKTDVAAVRTGSEANNTAIDSILAALEAQEVVKSS